MTSYNSVGSPREDVIFTRVKALMCACDGSLVAALADFQQRNDVAVEGGSKGLDYAAFLCYLREHGAGCLTESESSYLCNAFDDGVAPRKNGFISEKTFTRHLCGLNYRRMKAVMQSWNHLVESQSTDGKTVTADQLLSTYRAAAGGTSGLPHGPQLDGTFSAGRGGSTRYRHGQPQQPAKDGNGAAGDGEQRSEPVSKAEFIALYASISPSFRTDEAFEVAALKDWAADDPTRPVLHSTQRDWGENGDPLARDSPLYVQSALHTELGVSSKSYNYSQMAREAPYVEPLPALNRPDLMESTAQRTYKPFNEADCTLADPLATRRSQPM